MNNLFENKNARCYGGVYIDYKKQWYIYGEKSSSCLILIDCIIGGEYDYIEEQPFSREWWAEYFTEDDEHVMDHSGKLTVLFEILKMSEEIGDKV